VSSGPSPIKRPTISDVARAAAVSKATVSAVLNDVPGVRESTRERVRTAMELLNYRPARALAGRVAGREAATTAAMIALVIKEHDNPYYAAIVDGVRGVLEPEGHTLVIVSTGGDSGAERRAVTRLHATGIDGFIVTPVLGQDGDLSHFFELRRRNVPLVLLEQVRGLPAALVDVDNVEISRAAVEHLIGLGHTRIAHLAGPPYSMHSRERIDGVRRAFSASRLMLRDEDLVPAGAHLEDGYRAGLARFAGRSDEDRPTAVTCYNDLVAIGLCRALAELGLRVPEDVSVVGYDDIPLCDYLPVPLTTVQVPMQEMGVQSARLLLRILTAPAAVPLERVSLEASLVVRASTAAPRADAGRAEGARADGGRPPAVVPAGTPTPGAGATTPRQAGRRTAIGH
jgi:DNA-binding LacI/PurR family transcriptional regulator